MTTEPATHAQIFERAPTGLATIDAADEIRQVNVHGVELLGHERSRIVGTRLDALLAGDDVSAFHALGARVRSTEQPGTCDVRVAGERATVLRITAAVCPDAPGSLLLAFADLGHRADELVAMLSHELRNMMTPIHASLFVLALAAQGSREAREAREAIERQSQQLSRLADDVLEVMGLGRGKVRLVRARVDLAALVHQIAEDLRESFADDRIVFAVACVPGPIWIDADRRRIGQVVRNLLATARRATPEGGFVELAVEHSGDRAELHVRDGQGPRPSYRRRDFGLDLAIAEDIVALHGGTLEVGGDERGRGADVTVALPLA